MTPTRRPRRPVALAVGLPLALVVAGCVGAPPVRLPETAGPASSPPATWTVAAADTGSVGSWRDSFPADDLQALVAEALAHSPDLAAATARLEAAAAQARIGGADVWPTIDGSLAGARRKQVFVGLPIPGDGGPVTSESDSWAASLDVSWELDLWGRARAQGSAADADFQAARADWEGARLSLAGQTLKAVFAAREAARQAELARATLASQRRTEESIRVRYLEGVRPALDLRFAISDRAAAEAALAGRLATLDAQRRRLEVLLGRYPAGAIETDGELGPPPAAIPAGLPAELLARRPDLVAAERRLAAAGRRVHEAKAGLLPRIGLTASAGRSSDELGDLLDGDFSVWSLAANLLQPIFRGGRLRANVDRTASLEDAAELEWAGLVLRALGEVETALAAEARLAEQEDALTEAAEQAAAARSLAEQRYATGLDDVITLLSAQRQAAAAESRRLEVRRRRLETRVDLHLALGGGFLLPPPPNDEGDPS